MLTDQLFRDAAAAEGLSYHDFCVKYKIIGPSQDRRIRRHEVTQAEMSEGARREMENRTAYGDSALGSPNGSVITVSAPSKPEPRHRRDD